MCEVRDVGSSTKNCDNDFLGAVPPIVNNVLVAVLDVVIDASKVFAAAWLGFNWRDHVINMVPGLPLTKNLCQLCFAWSVY